MGRYCYDFDSKKIDISLLCPSLVAFFELVMMSIMRRDR